MNLKLWSKSFFNPRKQTALAACAAALLLGAAQTTSAAFLTWSDGANNMLWDTTSLNWLNVSTPSIWNSATPDSADFSFAGLGTVTLASNITAASITFDAGPYTLTNNTLTLAGPSPSITNNASATILSSLAGSSGLTKQGLFTLTLNNPVYSGPTLVSQGTLSLLQATGLQSLNININSGATLDFNTTGGTTPQAPVQWINAGPSSSFITGAGLLTFTGSGYTSFNWYDAHCDLLPGGMMDIQGGTTNALDVQAIYVTTESTFTTNLGGLNVASNCSFHCGQQFFQFDALTGQGEVAMGQGYPGGTGGIQPPLGTLTLGVNNTANNAAYGVSNNTAVFSGAIVDAESYGSVTTGALDLVKTGTGTQVLSGANTYSGTTTVNGGTLVFPNGISLYNSALVAVSGGTLIAQNLIIGPVTINSGGTMALGATGSGATVGTLVLNSSLTLNAGGTNFMRISKTGGSTAADTLEVGSGILDNGATLVVANITSDSTALALNDTFTLFYGAFTGNFANYVLPALPGNLLWDVSQVPVSGTIKVVNVLPAPNFSLGSGGYLGAQTLTISSTASGASIYYTTNGTTPTSSSFHYTGPITIPVNTTITIEAIAHESGFSDSPTTSATYQTEPSAVWLNAGGGAWGTSANWTNGIVPNQGSGTADFSQLTLSSSPTTVGLGGAWTIGNLIFGDLGNSNTWEVDPSGGTLTLASSNNSSTITVLNQSTSITAPLLGLDSLTTAGPGTLWLSGANSYSGGTTISSGELVANAGTALGANTSTLTLGNTNSGPNPIMFDIDQGVSGVVALAAINTTSDGSSQTITMNAGSALPGNSSELTIGALNLNGNLPLTIQSTNTTTHSTKQDIFYRVAGNGVPAGQTALILDGTQGRGVRTSFVNGAAANNFTGDVIIRGAINTQGLTYNGQIAANQYLNFPNNNVTVQANPTNAPNATLWTVVWGGETVQALNGDGYISLNCQNALNNVGLTMGNNNFSGAYAAAISGGWGVAKVGAGTETLTGTNTYTGVTIVSNGVLLVNSPGSLSASSAVSVWGGTLGGTGTINGSLTVQSNGTVALSGAGLLAGAATINGGGALEIGSAGLGAMNVGNVLTLNSGSMTYLRLSKTGGVAASDEVMVVGGLSQIVNNGGNLVVSNITSDTNVLALGDSFALFSFGPGNFNHITLPTLPGSLAWDISQLPASGAIAVVSSGATARPAFSPLPGGFVGTTVSVTLNCATPGATIYYTINGSTPTTNSSVYSTPILVPLNKTETITAFAQAAGYSPSAVVSGLYATESQQPVWINLAGGSWSASSDWTNNVIPNQAGLTVDFSELSLSSNTLVTLDGGWTIGNLLFADQGNAYSWTVAPGNSHLLGLTLSDGASTPTITVNNQSANVTALLAGGVTNAGLIKAGPGALWLGGANTYTGVTTVSAGTLSANNALALGPTNNTVILGSASTGTNDVGLDIDTNVSGVLTLASVATTSNGSSQTITLNGGSAYSSFQISTLNLNGNVPLTIQSSNTSGARTVQDIYYQIVGNGIPAGTTALTLNGTALLLRTSFPNGSAANNFTGDVVIEGAVNTQDLTYNGQTAANQNLGFLHNNVTVSNVPGGATTKWTIVWGGETIGALNGSGNISFNNQNALNNIGLTMGNTGVSGSYSGIISGGYGVAKIGAGTQILSGANTYTGVTVVSNGALEVDGSLAAGSAVSVWGGTLNGSGVINGTVTLQPGGTLGAGSSTAIGMFSLPNTVTLNAFSTNYMKISKTGGATTSDQVTGWSGALNYAGSLVVSNITSDGTPLALGDTFTLFPGASYGGGFSAYVLPALPAGTAWDVSQLGVSGSITVGNHPSSPVFSPPAGGFVGSQPVTVTISTITTGAAIYYTTDGSTPSLSSPSGASPVTVVVPVPTNMTIEAIVAGSGLSQSPVATGVYVTEFVAYWTNGGAGSWSAGSDWTNNVVPNQANATSDFSQVTLPSNSVVTLDGARTIGNLVFADKGNLYNWSVYTGTAGPLTLAGSNTPDVTVNNQTTTIGAVVAGTNGLTKLGAGTLTFSNANTYTGSTTISNGALRLDLTPRSGQLTLPSPFTSASSGTLELSNLSANVDGEYMAITINGNGTLNKTGTGYLDIWSGNSHIAAFTGQVNVQAGTLAGNGNDWSTSAGLMSLNVAAGATFDLRVGNVIVNQLTGSGTIGTTYVQSPILSVGNNNGSSSFSGVIQNSLPITGYSAGGTVQFTKKGTGTQTLSGANIYTGATTVSGGTLNVTGSLAAGSAVAVNSGGTLGGTGTIKGPVTVNSGGTLIAGTSSTMGTLTLTNSLTINTGGASFMRISKNGGLLASDVITGLAGGINFGGALMVTNVTSDTNLLAAGDSFRLLVSSGASSGSFQNFILPPLRTGLVWDWTPGVNVLSVVTATTAPKVTTSGPFNNGAFSLSFTGQSGRIYKVLMTTDLTLPQSSWTVLTSGTFGVGAVNFTDTAATNAQRFYLISSP